MTRRGWSTAIRCWCGTCRHCRGRARRRQANPGHPQFLTVAERFWQHTDTSAGPDACWPWTGHAVKQGRGRMNVSGRAVLATHISYEIHVGPVPDGLFVLHHCDNPPCVNPAHLYAGTRSDNAYDTVARGQHPFAGRKFTPDQVRAIRSRYAQGGVSQAAIAAEFGVAGSTITRLLSGFRYRTVTA